MPAERSSIFLVRYLAAFAVMAGVAPVAADDEEDSRRRGAVLAHELCSHCHIVAEGQRSGVPDGVPPFDTIANRAGNTDSRLRAFLVDPHPPMPRVPLSDSDITDIVAYLRSYTD